MGETTDRGVTWRDRVLPASSSVSATLKLVAVDCGRSSDVTRESWEACVGVAARSLSLTVMEDMRFIAPVTLSASSDPNMRLPRLEKFMLAMNPSSRRLSVGMAMPRGEYSPAVGSGVGMVVDVCVCVAGGLGG